MELFDINQDNAYVLKQLQLGVHIKKAYKSLDQKDLTVDELKAVQKSILSFPFRKHENFRVYDFEKSTWDAALDIKSQSNVSAPDTIHLATAIDAGCDVLVTLDSFFLKEASAYIKTCQPEQVENLLQEMGFKV
jgi:predicted nucleic acid-binding protein